MMTVSELSKRSGVTVRTLHYYDELGLLKPQLVSEAGYRYYGEESLLRLSQIMLFRELEFPLRSIKQILDSPDFDMNTALETQIALLQMKRERLDEIIECAKKLLENGGTEMNFKAFDTKRLEEYSKEAKERWGKTEAYAEYEKNSAARTAKEQSVLAEGLMSIFAEFGKIKETPPDSQAARSLVKKLQGYISENYYSCTDAVLKGLGAIYSAGGEMTDNIDAYSGEGTARFVSAAIDSALGS